MSATLTGPASTAVSATIGQRAVAALFSLASAVVIRLPDRLLVPVADLVGIAHYLIARRRRRLARRNMRRVCRYLTTHGPATPAVLSGALGGRALERMVRGVFRHHARYYLEVMLTSRYTPDYLADHLELDDPELVNGAFGAVRPGHGAIFVGLHFGSIELPVVFATQVHGLRAVAPMETIANPALQAYYLAQRSRVGVRLIDPGGTRGALVRAIEEGGLVGLVADRDLGGTSRPVKLFGAQTSLPVGPALLALQTGAPAWVTGVRRADFGEYIAKLIPLDAGQAGAADPRLPLRERVARLMRAQARAYERVVADAPEQWWTLLFPIWTSGEADA
jgi:phosphatidylinositol dimannoside acyltransferase